MTTAYPLTFPCVSRIEGHSAAIDAGLVRTPMNAGNSRQRRSYRSLPHMISLVFVVEQDLLAPWLAWLNAHAWDEWIELKLPGLHAGSLGLNVAPTLVRFCSDLQTDLVQVHRLWLWRVRVACEFQPTGADFPVITGAWILGGTPTTPAPDWVIGGTPTAPAPIFTNPGTLALPVVYA